MNEPDWSDKILDSLLREVVDGNRPPDLTARIVAAWKQQRDESASSSSQGVTASVPEIIVSADALQAVPVVQARDAAAAPRKLPVRWSALLAVAAGGLLTAWGIHWYSSSASNTLANRPNNRPDAAVAAANVPNVAKAPRTKTQATENQATENQATENLANKESLELPKVKPEQLSLQKVPTQSNPRNRSNRPVERLSSGDTENRLSQQEIVELIDSQLATIWQQLGVVPAERLDDESYLQALSQTLTGQPLPADIRSTLTGKLSERRERVLSVAMSSQAFENRLADTLVNPWFKGGKLPLDSEPVLNLKDMVLQSIAERRAWNEVAVEALAGDALPAALAGDGNHLLVRKLGEHFLGTSLTCGRCHESPSIDGKPVTQDQYWSLVAMTRGIDAKKSTTTSLPAVEDKQLELIATGKIGGVFFERLDGGLEEAKLLLPNGQNWNSVPGAKSPRMALARWLGNADTVDRAVVNQVWSLTMGRPLVAANALLDDTGLQERIDLQNLLAQQFRAQGRDVVRLVGWIVRSDAFARSAISLDRERWLTASDSDLAAWHLAESTFAARSSLGRSSLANSMEKSLAALVKWNRVKSSNGTVLAQPKLSENKSNPESKPKAASPSELEMPEAGYLIHRGRLSVAQSQFLDRLLVSEKLNWDDKVQHVLSLAPDLVLDARATALIAELQTTLSDKKAVLAELLWLAENASATPATDK